MDIHTEEKRVWGIHTQNDTLFLKKGLIAIGWRDFGDLTKVVASRDAFKTHYAEVYPTEKKRRLQTEQECFTGFSMKCKLAIMLYSHPKRIG